MSANPATALEESRYPAVHCRLLLLILLQLLFLLFHLPAPVSDSPSVSLLFMRCDYKDHNSIEGIVKVLEGLCTHSRGVPEAVAVRKHFDG